MVMSKYIALFAAILSVAVVLTAMWITR